MSRPVRIVDSADSAGSSLVQLLLAMGRDHGSRPAASFIADDAPMTSPAVLTYGQLDRSARCLAGWLQGRYPPGTRVLLLYPQGVEFVTAFVGCLYAGMVPVPASLPSVDGGHGQPAQHDRTSTIAGSCGAELVLTDERNTARVAAWLAGAGLDHLTCVTSLRGDSGDATAWRPPAADPQALAFLQYTPGTTGQPLGVPVTHGQLLANLELIRRSFALPAGLRAGGWLPLHHGPGLVWLLLLPLYLGGQTALISPASFLWRPHRWLELVDRYGVALSAAPNFAFDLCVRRVSPQRVARLNLSRWSFVCSGFEPVCAATLQDFADHLAPAGLRPQAILPCYGLAEATMLVTADRPGREPVVTRVHAELLEQHRFVPCGRDEPGRAMVSSGPVPAGVGLRIVDPDSGKALADGEVGEIWLRGPSVAAGYWRQPELAERTFLASTADGEGPFLRTGDLGVRHDGELFITGRRQGLVTVRGRNLYPQDIEREAASLHPGLADGAGAVFDVPVDGGATMVVVHEVRPGVWQSAELAVLAADIQIGLSCNLGLDVSNVVLVPFGTVLRGAGGAVQRHAMRELFTADSLQPLFEDLAPDIRTRYRPLQRPPIAPQP